METPGVLREVRTEYVILIYGNFLRPAASIEVSSVFK
jgi:hypothetical protein